MLKNKTLLITGGTGSFGNAVLQKFLNSDLAEIRILSRDEKKQEDMRLQYNNNKLSFYIGDVRDTESLNNAFRDVDFVFHAAALKQVPSCEFYPNEAVKTNIFGTQNVINASINHKLKKVILLSTDKAVYPVNAMGISKAMAEKILIAQSRLLNRNETILCATRYGNVMASRGSVIPLFVDQIKNKQPLTVTDPKMTRFLMSLEESVELVKYSITNARQGDIYVQKSKACNMKNLALALKEIFNSKSEIKIVGTRHGEKKHESLLSREEMSRVINKGNFFRVPADMRNLNYDNYFTKGNTKQSLSEDYNSSNTKQLNKNEIIKILSKLKFIKKELSK